MDSGRDVPSNPEKGRRVRLLGGMILVASAVLWAAVAVVPFLPLPGARKIWAAAVVLGREAVRCYRGFLNPRNWFGGKRR